MCEVISCGYAHPGVSGGWRLLLLLIGLAVVTARETKGAVDGSVWVELGETWQATGEVVRAAAGVRIGWWQAWTVVAPLV